MIHALIDVAAFCGIAAKRPPTGVSWFTPRHPPFDPVQTIYTDGIDKIYKKAYE